jgi:hypothetical protein
LLRKEQYFSVPTYEGRKPTQLKGEWNLRDTLVRVRPRAAADEIALAGSFSLVRAAAPVWLTAAPGAGWHAMERDGRDRWRWAADAGWIEVNNPGAVPVRVDLRLRAKGLKAGRLLLKLDGRILAERPLGAAPGDIEVTGLELPAGASVLTCETGEPAVSPGGGDDRRLSLALFDLVISAADGQ